MGNRGFLVTVFDGFGFALITERARCLVDIGDNSREIVCARPSFGRGK
jgi:hypothetical protein